MSTLKTASLQHPDASSNTIHLSASGNVGIGTNSPTAKLDLGGNNVAGISSINSGQVGGRRNLIINGAMQLAQRATSASVTDGTNEGYQTLDRWRFVFANNAGGACIISRDTDVPSGYGFSNSYKVDVTTADTSIASGHHIIFHQKIEAQDLRNSGWNYTSSSSYLTLSFWVKSNKTGTYCIDANAVDVGGNFKFVKEYTIDSASTWEYKTIKIPGNSSLVINNDANPGMEIEWNLQTASDRANATDNTWHTSDGSRCTSNQVNFFDSTDNNFWITGVQLEVGDTATTFEHRSYGEELNLCLRYFEKINYTNTEFVALGVSGTTTTANANFEYTKKRVAPTIDLPNAGQGSGNISYLTSVGGYPSGTGDHSVQTPAIDQCRIHGFSYTGLTAAGPSYLFSTGSTSISIDAEL